jgi:hypothetical protein
MRVLMVLFAMVATPFALGVAQAAQPADAHAANCVKRDAKITNLTARERALQKCSLVPTTPPSDDPPPPTWDGNSSIDGTVFQASDPWPGLAGWTVTLSGAVSTSTASGASGNYVFAGLPAGTYTVCVTVQAGWVQTFPTSGTACATGVGYTFELTEGTSGSWVNFGVVPQ